jgi:hypothetical protein
MKHEKSISAHIYITFNVEYWHKKFSQLFNFVYNSTTLLITFFFSFKIFIISILLTKIKQKSFVMMHRRDNLTRLDFIQLYSVEKIELSCSPRRFMSLEINILLRKQKSLCDYVYVHVYTEQKQVETKMRERGRFFKQQIEIYCWGVIYQEWIKVYKTTK